MSSKKTFGQEANEKSSDGKNRGWPKGKRRYPKGAGAPKQPLSGYVHFLNERRESVRSRNPDITFSELSKKLAAEWSSMGNGEKNRYHDIAKKDKDRYDKEFIEYQNTDAYKKYIESQNSTNHDSSAKKKKIMQADCKSVCSLDMESVAASSSLNGETDTNTKSSPQSQSDFHIPIFTQQFLQYNKTRENELRHLHKQNIDFEEQNTLLAKHIDSMKSAITKLELETQQQRQSNASLHHNLQSLRQLLSQGFKGVQVPGFKNVTDENIDEILSMLLGIVKEKPLQHQPLINTARSIVARLEYCHNIS